jgi:hypothetical protein
MNELPDRERAAVLDDEQNWSGGFYELTITLGARDDGRLESALRALWRAAGVTGPFAGRWGGPLKPVELTLASLEANGHLRGVVRLPSVGPVVAGAVATRFDAGYDDLVFYMPMGALARTDRRVGGFPFDAPGSDTSWIRDLDASLAIIGQRIYSEVRFAHAFVGVEGFDQWDDAWDVTPPTHRPVGLLIPSGDELTYLPTTYE